MKGLGDFPDSGFAGEPEDFLFIRRDRNPANPLILKIRVRTMMAG